MTENSIFVIPQEKAARKFRAILSDKVIHRVYLATWRGDRLFDLLLKINLGKILPRPFWAPCQAIVTVLSIFSRILRIEIIFEVEDRLT